jgi:uroporphyrinogen decarboxylase
MNAPDFQNIVDAALNKKSSRIPLYEHIVSPLIIEKMTGKKFADLVNGNREDKKEFFRHFSGFFRAAGYDTVSFECCAGSAMPGSGALGGHKEGVIKTRKDFDEYPWASIPDLYFDANRETLRAFAETLPEGMKGIGGVGNGIFECVQDITGFQEL